MKVAWFFVEYHNYEEIVNLIKRNLSEHVDYYVWCNGRTERVPALDEIAEVTYSTENIGYLNPFLIGARKLFEEKKEYDYFVLSNSDIELAPDFLSTLFNLELNEHTGGIAPEIKLPTGVYQNPNLVQRHTTKKMNSLVKIYSSKLLFRMFIFLHNVKKKLKKKRQTQHSSMNIYSMHGSLMILRKKANLHEWSHFDAFLQNEEYHVAEELRKRGLKIWYETQLKMIHNEHSTTGKSKLDTLRKWHLESLSFIVNKHFSD